MRCWRDLSQVCAENDCPMWMDGLNPAILDSNNEIGLKNSKCAMVLKEKITFYQGLFDIFDYIEGDEDLLEEDFLDLVDDTPRETSNQRLPIKETHPTSLPLYSRKKTPREETRSAPRKKTAKKK